MLCMYIYYNPWWRKIKDYQIVWTLIITDFGPLTRTADPEVFKKLINSLSATGGGDFPEMSLSALQVL